MRGWDEDGKQWYSKKNLMTALGLVEGVGRTMYRDNAFDKSAYPLDDKIGLLSINDNRSRYTQVFAWNVARLYAELTEEDAASAIKAMLGIEINKTQITKVAQAVAKNYTKPVDTSIPNNQMDTEGSEEVVKNNDQMDTEATEEVVKNNDQIDTEGSEEVAENIEDQPCEKVDSEGFLAEKLRELDARPDRDAIIQAAVDGKLNGIEGGETMQIAMYLSSDGSGVPGLRRELSDNGKNGGKAGTFEAKIGCTFRQGFTANGMPVLDKGKITRIPDTTKYTGTTEKIGGFSPLFTDFAIKNGIFGAKQVIFLCDGALWLKNMQMRLYPTAIFIVDFFHAAEHLDDVISALRFDSPEKRKEFADKCGHLLELGDIGQLTELIRSKMNKSDEETIEKKLAYFERNADRMRYGLFRAVGLFIGSGVMEAACKTIVGKRLKNAGMHWSKKNANGVIALRCAICSNEFEVPGINNSLAA